MRPRSEVHRGLLNGTVHIHQTGLDDYHAIGHSKQRVAENDRKKSSFGPAKCILSTHHQEQERETDHHFRHHQRCIDHTGEDGAASEATVSNQDKGGKST